MNNNSKLKIINKKKMTEKLFKGKSSSLQRYQDFFIGTRKIGDLLTYELIIFFSCALPGAIGLMLRKILYSRLVKTVGKNVLWGRNIALRCPKKIQIGNQVAIDDNCLLDAKGSDEGLTIGNNITIARDTILLCKNSWIHIGDQCVIGSQSMLGSAGGISLGNKVMVGGQVYIGGGRYKMEDTNTAMMDQDVFSTGPVIIEDDVWLGAGVTVLDGVRIGKGSFIGAGAVIAENIRPFTIVAPHQKFLKLTRLPSDSHTNRKEISTKNDLTINGEKPKTLKTQTKDKPQLYSIILQAVLDAVNEINMQLPEEDRLEKDETTILYKNSKECNINSLALLNLIVTTEQKVEEEIGTPISLTNEEIITNDTNPLQTIGTFADHIAKLII